MNDNKLIRTDKIVLAKIKYFDVKHNGVEVTSEDPYAFLINVDGTYVNLFDPADELPVYERSNYSNYTKDGEAFGSKIMLRQGIEKDGPCYVIEKLNLRNLFNKDLIHYYDLVNYMIKSDKFFVDRKEFILEKAKSRYDKKLMSKYFSDCKKLDDFKYFISSHDNMIQYIK